MISKTLLIGIIVLLVIVVAAIIYVSNPSSKPSGTTTVVQTSVVTSSIGTGTGSNVSQNSGSYSSLSDSINQKANNETVFHVNYSFSGQLYSFSTNLSLIPVSANLSYAKYYQNATMYEVGWQHQNNNYTKFLAVDANINESNEYSCSGLSGPVANQSENPIPTISCIKVTPPNQLNLSNWLFAAALIGNQNLQNITLNTAGTRTFDGQQCALITGNGTNSKATMSFTACISDLYGVPLNVTTIETTSAGTATQNYIATSIGQNVNKTIVQTVVTLATQGAT